MIIILLPSIEIFLLLKRLHSYVLGGIRDRPHHIICNIDVLLWTGLQQQEVTARQPHCMSLPGLILQAGIRISLIMRSYYALTISLSPFLISHTYSIRYCCHTQRIPFCCKIPFTVSTTCQVWFAPGYTYIDPRWDITHGTKQEFKKMVKITIKTTFHLTFV